MVVLLIIIQYSLCLSFLRIALMAFQTSYLSPKLDTKKTYTTECFVLNFLLSYLKMLEDTEFKKLSKEKYHVLVL